MVLYSLIFHIHLTSITCNSTTEYKPYYPKGGTTVEEIRRFINSLCTISLTKYAGSGALSLEKKYNVPAELGPIPRASTKY